MLWGEGGCPGGFVLILCFVFVVTLLRKTVYSSATTQITVYLMDKTLQLTIPW